jgi:hypothetical protein
LVPAAFIYIDRFRVLTEELFRVYVQGRRPAPAVAWTPAPQFSERDEPAARERDPEAPL